MSGFEIVDGITLFPQAKTVLAMPSSADIFDETGMQPLKIDNLEIAPWGAANDLPDEAVKKIERSIVLSSNLQFNTAVAYGLGAKPMRRTVVDGKIVGREEIVSGPEYEFFEDNDVNLFLLSQLNDVCTFYNAFPEIILGEDKKKIVSLRSKEAMYSRWSRMDGKGTINYHYYSAKWAEGAKKEDIIVTDVLDEYNPYRDLTAMLESGRYKDLRFIVPVFMPAPGRPYYPKAPWWSVFESGWYDLSAMLAPLKTAILKNKLGVQHIIYISDKYFDELFKSEGIDGIDQSKKEAQKKRKREEHQRISDFLGGESNAGKSLLALKKFIASGSGGVFEKYIEIETIKNDMSGGELISDSEEASNMLCYAMGIHPNLIGATPGKSSGSMGGTDKRELFMIKQALMKPYVDRILRVFSLIKKFNKWDENFFVSIPEYVFTTLDKNKSGKEVKENVD